MAAAVVFATLIATAAIASAGVGMSSGATKTITFFDWTSLHNPVGAQLIKEYEASHPNTRIKLVPMPTGDPYPSINASLAGGVASDIMTLATDQQTWKDLSKGWWTDLTKYAMAPNPYVKGNKRWIDLLTPGAAKALRFADGRIYSLSTTGFDVGFIYNKDVFAKVGLTQPKTWEALVSALEKLKKANYIPLVYELGDTPYGAQAPAFITILEGTVMHKSIAKMDKNHDGVVDVRELVTGIRNGTYSAKNADYQESWKLLKSLSPYFQLGASSTTSAAAGFNVFKSGRVGMWWEGSFNYASLAQTKIKWAAFPMPRLTKKTTPFATSGPQSTGAFGACCGYPWSIPASTAKNGNIERAIDVLYWLSQPRITERYAAGSGVLSALRKAAPQPQLAAFQQAASHVSPVAWAELAFLPQFMETRSRLVEQYVNGSISLQDAMKQMQKEMEADAERAAKLFQVK